MLLGLDTTTEWLHVALVDMNGSPDRCPADASDVGYPLSWTRAQRASPTQTHSNLLLPLVEEVLQEAGITPKNLTGCVVCVGPGGFTSLRTGVATAEGLALTGLPTWGFSAFEWRAEALCQSGAKAPFWVLLDGQRNEAFAQCWQGGNGKAQKLPLAHLQSTVDHIPWWAPDTFRAKIEALMPHPAIRLTEESVSMQQALVAMVQRKSMEEPENPLVPFYLRETDAEVNFPQHSFHLPDALRRGHER